MTSTVGRQRARPAAAAAPSPPVALLLVALLILACAPVPVTQALSMASGVYSENDRRALADESAAFMAQRAREPSVHRFRSPAHYGGHEALMERIGPTAEVAYETRWSDRFSRGVPHDQPRRPPVCAAGLENDDGELEPPSNVPYKPMDGVQETGLLDVHVNLSHCRTVPGDFLTVIATDTSPLLTGAPVRLSYRDVNRFDLVSGLRPIVKLLPEGETWRIDLPPQLAYGMAGQLGGGGLQVPPNCHVRVDVRVERVMRGRTSLARCRQALAESIGYDPNLRNGEEHSGEDRGGRASVEAVRDAAAGHSQRGGALDRATAADDSEDL